MLLLEGLIDAVHVTLGGRAQSCESVEQAASHAESVGLNHSVMRDVGAVDPPHSRVPDRQRGGLHGDIFDFVSGKQFQ